VSYPLLVRCATQWRVGVAAANSSGGDAPLTVGFTSAGSTDLDGALLAYDWDFRDGAVSGLPDPGHAFAAPGNYVVTLTVTDDQGAQSSNTVPVAVTAPNQMPVAVAYADPPRRGARLAVVLE